MDENLRQNIDKYKDLEWNLLLRKDLGSHSLEEAKPIFDRIKEVFDTVINHPELKQFPPQFQASLGSHLDSFLKFAEQIINSYQNTAEKQSWFDKIRNKEFEIKQSIGPFYTDLVLRDPGRGAELKQKTEEAQEQLKSISEKLDDAQNLLKTAQDRAQEVEAGKFGSFFGGCAKDNARDAKKARDGMTISIGGTAVLAILFLAGDADTFANLKFGELIDQILSQSFLLKLVILSLGGYAVAHFSRDYAAEKHLHHLNLQRQNALDSHQQLLKSIRPTESENDKETANAMLAELTRAIFDATDTGYLKKVSNPGNPIRQAVELTRSETR